MVHFAGQAAPAAPWLGRENLPWLLVGCLLPDLPWIGQRLAELAGNPWPYDVRLYAIAQSTLACSLLAAAALAALAERPWPVFAILCGGALAHLLLDAMEAKLGNGVLLFAPFSWSLINWGWYWTESAISVALTLAGGIWIAWVLARRPVLPRLRLDARRLSWAGLFAVAWLLVPLAWMGSAEAADLHFVHTLREREARTGRTLELDRNRFEPGPDGGSLLLWTGERLRADGLALAAPAVVSLRGRFADPGRLEVERAHVHWRGFRDAATYVGLAATLVYWMRGRRADQEH